MKITYNSMLISLCVINLFATKSPEKKLILFSNNSSIYYSHDTLNNTETFTTIGPKSIQQIHRDLERYYFVTTIDPFSNSPIFIEDTTMSQSSLKQIFNKLFEFYCSHQTLKKSYRKSI